MTDGGRRPEPRGRCWLIRPKRRWTSAAARKALPTILQWKAITVGRKPAVRRQWQQQPGLPFADYVLATWSHQTARPGLSFPGTHLHSHPGAEGSRMERDCRLRKP